MTILIKGAGEQWQRIATEIQMIHSKLIEAQGGGETSCVSHTRLSAATTCRLRVFFFDCRLSNSRIRITTSQGQAETSDWNHNNGEPPLS